MTPFIIDIIILVLLFISALIAFFRGFIKEVLTIFSLVGAIGGAYFWGKELIPFFEGWGKELIDSEDKLIWGMIPLDIFAPVAAYGLVFAGLFAALSVISHFVGKSAQEIGLGAIDRTLGFVFGLARGIFILALINILVLALVGGIDNQPTWLKEARSMVIINRASEVLSAIKPDSESLDYFENAKKELKQKVKNSKESTTTDSSKGYNLDERKNMQNLLETIE